VTQIFYEEATHVMPTKTIVDPQNGSGQQIALMTYDFYTGLPTGSTDINGNVSTISYTNHLLNAVDPFGRTGTVYSPYATIDGASKRQTVKTYYQDSTRITRVESDLFNEGDALLKSKETRDQLGRTTFSERNENGAAAYTVSSQTIYKTAERVVMTSNPRRAAAAATDGWTRVTNDVLGRTIEAVTFSGTAAPPLTGTNANWTGSATSAYSANQTTVTDQAGKKRRSVANALGQLSRVDEPKADTGELDVNNIPYQSTSYEYDPLGNLKKVTQGAQVRQFFYDSLSRLKEAQNPESGTINYTYDSNGNLQTKRDPRGIKTVYDYDGLNRLVKRCYRNIGTTAQLGLTTCGNNNETLLTNAPDAAYTYENSTVTGLKGVLTKITNGLSTTDYQSFDELGRIKQSRQTTDGTAYNPMTYSYNLSGVLVEQKYPSGRILKNQLNNSGELSSVTSKKSAAGQFWNYASNFTYTAAGAVSSIQLGNLSWESTQFNARLQPTQIALGTTQAATNLLKLDYTYNTTGQADNNGNVKTQTITAPSTPGQSNGFTATQTYNYDSLNRLKDASEVIGTQTWKQTYKYDRFGNREFDAANTTTLGSCSQSFCNPTISATDNRFNTGQGYSYDNAGNLKTDAEGKQFTYDGENKQTEVKNSANQSLGTYFYDADGRRVKKVVPSTGETTIFIYDAAGKLVAEYSTVVETAANAKVGYLTQDHLGSPRIVSDRNGNVTSRRDFLPFGEEIGVNTTQTTGRSGHSQYSGDSRRQKFTGYERDNETDLDYAKARYYSKNHGRFTTTDPLLASGKPITPQTWNRYSYVINNPLRFIDPTGLCTAPSGLKPGQVGICFEAFIASKTVGLGGIGKGDGRGFNGNNENLTARVTVWSIISLTEKTVNATKDERISPSEVEVKTQLTENGRIGLPDGSTYSSEIGVSTSLQGTAATDVQLSNINSKQGEKDFGAGVDVTVSIADGKNGFQVNPVTGLVAPAGTIDGSVTLRITGSGNVTGVSANGRPFPSYAAYSYTVDADGKTIQTKVHLRQEETPPVENLTKPVQSFKIIQ
jgi:RHS repeat-associated protein